MGWKEDTSGLRFGAAGVPRDVGRLQQHQDRDGDREHKTVAAVERLASGASCYQTLPAYLTDGSYRCFRSLTPIDECS